MTPKFVNSIGLIFDIAGVVLVWKYGLPESISRTGATYLLLEESDATEIARANKYDKRSRIGLSLLMLGFIGQLISNFL
jgi:hypothetical protein